MIVDVYTYLLALGAGATGASPLVVQAAADPSGLGLGTLVTSGAVTTLAGVVAGFGKFVLGREVARGDELRVELRESRAENRQLTEKIMGEYAPTLARATDALSSLTSMLARGQGH